MADRRDNSQILSALSVIEGKVDKLVDVINGTNGTVGLKTDQALTKQKLNDHIADAKAHKDIWSRVVPTVISTVVGGAIMFIITAAIAAGK